MQISEKWNIALGRFLRSELTRHGVTHEQLAKLLETQGVLCSKSSIDSKLSRGTFSAVFFMQCLIAIGYESNDVEEVKRIIKK